MLQVHTGQLYQVIDQYRYSRDHQHIQSLTLNLLILVSSFAFTSFAFAQESSLQDLNEFNQESTQWTKYRSTTHRTGGWRYVAHDREGSIRTVNSRAYGAVNWRLSKTLNLRDYTQPKVSIKSYFTGHDYQSFKIYLEDEEDHQHLLHQQSQADAKPQVRQFDLREFKGKTVRIVLSLQKAQGVKINRVGLYIHHVNLYQERSIIEIPNLKIAAFNIQIFGVSKMDKPHVVEALLEILSEFDLILIQEIRDASGEAIDELMQALNQRDDHFAITLSERLGRTRSKEQYAFIYRSDLLQLLHAEVLPDPEDHFERGIYLANFIHLASDQSLTFLGTHLSPGDAEAEMLALADHVEDELDHLHADEELIVFGDFNADCRYLTQRERDEDRLLNDLNLYSYIDDSMDTTTSSTDCAYDRLLSTISQATDNGEEASIIKSGVFNYDQYFEYDEALSRAISDHYPVWAEIQW